MATRYVAKKTHFRVDKNGRKRYFTAGHTRPDGTPGYTRDEVTGLYRDHLKGMFDEIQVQIVEQATAAPGERRFVEMPDEGDANVCVVCGKETKTAAALGSHMRVHEDDE